MYNSLMAACPTTSTFGFIHDITVEKRKAVGMARKDIFWMWTDAMVVSYDS